MEQGFNFYPPIIPNRSFPVCQIRKPMLLPVIFVRQTRGFPAHEASKKVGRKIPSSHFSQGKMWESGGSLLKGSL